MLKKFTTLFFILICASLFKANAQNCTIVSPDFGCLGDPITFKVVLPGGGSPTSHSWKLDPDTSSQANVSTTYTSPGVKNISVTVKLSGGGTCVATKQITIHDPPNTNFIIASNSSFCRKIGQVCIDDLTTLGTTGVPVEKVIVVWGDGNADSSSVMGKQYCHSYLNAGTFTITMEVRNDKGCTKKIEQNVVIGAEFDLRYRTDTFREWCDSIRICFRNLNTTLDVPNPLDKPDAQSLIWDFGDGEKDTSLNSFFTVCHTYRKEGVFQHNFTVTSKGGCNNTYTETIDDPYDPGNPIYNTHFTKHTFTLDKDKDSACYEEQIFSYTTQAKVGVEYEWGFKTNPDTNIVYGVFSEGPSGLLYPGKLGPIFVRLKVHRGDLCNRFLFDTINVCGPVASIDARNKKQCKLQDTVYFCDNSSYECVTQLYRLWDFDDPNAPQCTTDLANNINVGMNCNYSKDPLPQHYYSDTGCYQPKIYLYDSALMCGDIDSILIEMGTIDASKLNINYKLPCEGFKLDYVFQFDIGRESCIIPYAEINFDSACGKDKWLPFQSSHIYTSHCQDDDSVTIGLALKFGEPVRYRSCMMGDYFYDPDNVCTDTVWYHDQFKLSQEPSIKIVKVVKSDSCLPINIKTILQDSIYPYPEIKYYEYRWRMDEIHRDTFDVGDSLIQFPDLVIDTTGRYHVFVKIENEAGCYDSDSSENLEVGFFGDFYVHDPLRFNISTPWLSRDTLFCVGDTVLYGDTIRYFNNPTEFWRMPGPEDIHWDFGDGSGFIGMGALPTHVYNAPGIYQIKMAARDRNGCWDTIAHPVYISGVEAGIKKPTQAYLCDDIVQLFDSSQIKLNLQNDSIVDWFWRYSDGKPDNFVKNPFHSFTSNGFFTITHAVTTKFGCVDTVQSSIEILGPKPSFDIVSDTVGCVPFTAEFKNTSTDVFEWIWRFGDPGNSVFSTKGDTNVTFTYTQPGWYNISLYGTDSLFNPTTGSYKYCSATFPDSTEVPKPIRRVLVLPIPPVDFDMPTEVCVDEVFNVSDQSDTIYELYKWRIPKVNDSIISINKQVSYQFGDTGKYTFVYTPTYVPIPPYQRYCFDTTQKVIEVKDVKADFILDTNKSDMPYFAFINTSSSNAVQFEWDFGHPRSGADNYADSRDADHDYQSDTGSYDVCLIAYSDLGCVDTVCKTIKNRFFVYVIIPNVFTPENADGFNDAFDIDIFGEELYDLVIYNRWGEVVFRGDTDGYGNDGINWDGTTPGGNKHPAGTYYFIFKYQLKGMDAPEEISGVVTLIRPKN